MATIRTNCPHCDQAVDLSPEEILLAVQSGDETTGDYSFVCPACVLIAVRPADERIVNALVALGVEVVDLSATRTPHPEDPPAGPPLTEDDLLDLHLLLASDDWLPQLIACCNP